MFPHFYRSIVVSHNGAVEVLTVKHREGNRDQLSTMKQTSCFSALCLAATAVVLGIWIGQCDCSHQRVICNTLCPPPASHWHSAKETQPLCSLQICLSFDTLFNFGINYE